MNGVLQKLFVSLVLITLFFSGSSTGFAANEERIEFPKYKLSFKSPPNIWKILKKRSPDQLVAWKYVDYRGNRESAIHIFVGKLEKSESFHDLVEYSAKLTIDQWKEGFPDISFEVVEEGVEIINKKQYFRAKTLFKLAPWLYHQDIIYYHESEKFYYLFIFFDRYCYKEEHENSGSLSKEMMQSVTFLD